MIHHTYTSSVISLRPSLSFNDYAYYSNERCPSSYCSCCCSFSVHSPRFIVPINPSFLYGLRQSTLIQCPPSRRFIVGTGDRCCSRLPVARVGRSCNGECCCVQRERFVGRSCEEKCCVKKKISVDVSVNNKIKGRMDRVGRHNYGFSAMRDAEAMLSLLAEEGFEECLDVMERTRRSSNVACEACKGRNEYFGSGYSGGRSSRYRLELEKMKSRAEDNKRREERRFLLKDSSKVQSREEGYKRRGEREDFSKEEERWSRRHGSSSSYYSASEASELESDMEVEVQDGGSVGESYSGDEKDSRRFGSVVISEENKKESRRHRDERDQRFQSSEHVNSRQKLEGVVISEETKKDSKRYVDEGKQQVQTSRHDGVRMGSSTEWDWRKKSEKRLAEESSEETKVRKDSVVRHSQLVSEAHESRSSMKASRSEKQSQYLEEGSSYGESSHSQLRSRINKEDYQVGEYLKSSANARHEISTQTTRHDVGTSSSMQGESNLREDGTMVVSQSSAQETGCEYCKTCGRTIQQGSRQTGRQQRLEVSKISDDVRLSSTVQDQLESRLENNSSSTSLQTSTQRRNEQRDQATHVVTNQVETRRKLRHSQSVDTHDSRVESTVSSHQQSGVQTKTSEGNSSLQLSKLEVEGLLEKSEGKVIRETESSSMAQTGITSIQTHSTNAEINRQSASEQIIYNEQIYSKKVKSEEELVRKHKYIDETIVQSRIRTEVQGPNVEAVYTGNYSGEASASQTSTALVSQTGIQQPSEGEANFASQTSTALVSQTGIQQPSEGEANVALQISISPSSGDSLDSSKRNDFGGIAQVGSGSGYIHPQARVPSASDEVTSVMESYVETSHEDAIGSAERMEESSVHVIGGFVEKMGHESSTSQIGIEGTVSQQQSEHQVGTGTLSSYDELSDYRLEPNEGSSLEYALVSAERMEESATQIVGEFVDKVQHEASTSQSTITKKPSRLGSRPQDETYMLEGSSQSDSENTVIQKQESSPSSGGSEIKRPSDEMWDAKDHFGQEMESSNGAASENNVGVGRTGKSLWSIVSGMFRILNPETQKPSVKDESLSSEDEADESNSDGSKRSSPETRKEDLGKAVLGAEVGTSSSLSIVQPGLHSGGVSSGSNAEWNVTQQMSQPTPSDLRSHSSGEIDVRKTGSSGETKRKLQRSSQVLNVRYDEWELAYRREREQRKVDEIFMREALVEAKKASDAWEVPVGAVLVQDGNIIARGYNLVEELRDSTAHAEMICIREASNALRSWRLSETTLYVTLEPCPMCAGAILQARVGTLVWGAPNKLLGADGSWIRLLPEAEGEERPEVVEKPAAPAHPFHPNMKIRRGVLEAECVDIMQQFFQLRRRRQKKPEESSQKPKLLHKMFKFPGIHRKHSS